MIHHSGGGGAPQAGVDSIYRNAVAGSMTPQNATTYALEAGARQLLHSYLVFLHRPTPGFRPREDSRLKPKTVCQEAETAADLLSRTTRAYGVYEAVMADLLHLRAAVASQARHCAVPAVTSRRCACMPPKLQPWRRLGMTDMSLDMPQEFASAPERQVAGLDSSGPTSSQISLSHVIMNQSRHVPAV